MSEDFMKFDIQPRQNVLYITDSDEHIATLMLIHKNIIDKSAASRTSEYPDEYMFCIGMDRLVKNLKANNETETLENLMQLVTRGENVGYFVIATAADPDDLDPRFLSAFSNVVVVR